MVTLGPDTRLAPPPFRPRTRWRPTAPRAVRIKEGGNPEEQSQPLVKEQGITAKEVKIDLNGDNK